MDGPVYAAAKKAAHMQPLNPAAHNVLGLASGEPLLLEQQLLILLLLLALRLDF